MLVMMQMHCCLSGPVAMDPRLLAAHETTDGARNDRRAISVYAAGSQLHSRFAYPSQLLSAKGGLANRPHQGRKTAVSHAVYSARQPLHLTSR